MIDGEKAAKIDARLFEGIRDLAMTPSHCLQKPQQVILLSPLSFLFQCETVETGHEICCGAGHMSQLNEQAATTHKSFIYMRSVFVDAIAS